jgi:tetratricopeptide (TPR) repeat protein
MNTGVENMQGAVDALRSAIAINKNFPDVHLFLGIAYKNLEDFDSAEEAFLSAYALDPKNAVALTEISRSYFADGRYTQAAQYAEEAVRIEPENPRMHGDLGINYYKMQDYNRAIPELQLATYGGKLKDGAQVTGLPLDYNLRVMSYYWYYGLALAYNNNCREAVPVFQDLLANVPNDETAVYNANFGLEVCQQNLDRTPVPETDEGDVEEESPPLQPAG